METSRLTCCVGVTLFGWTRRHQSVLDYLVGMGERFSESSAAFEREAGVAKSADGEPVRSSPWLIHTRY
jgi:hypothetical protein